MEDMGNIGQPWCCRERCKRTSVSFWDHLELGATSERLPPKDWDFKKNILRTQPSGYELHFFGG